MTGLSLYALNQGLQEARRIIRDAAGYSFAMGIVPFAPEFKRQAEQALDVLEHQARCWRVATLFRESQDRRRTDLSAIEREVVIADGRG